MLLSILFTSAGLGECLKKANASLLAGWLAGRCSIFRKALPGFFLCCFQLPYLPEETCFQQAGSSVVEGTSQAVLGSSD
jgi:hypothetical protein